MSKGLPKIKLGRTDMMVTRLGYGAMELRGSEIWEGRPVTKKQAETILNTVLDEGINFIDTANAYGPSEEYIGKYIKHRRKEYYLATKCNNYEGLHLSLKRLQMDSVDLIQLHNPSLEWIEKNDTIRTLQKMKQEGKTRWIGMSTGMPDLPVVLNWGVFDVIQTHY